MLYFRLFLAISLFSGGWYARTVWDGYKAKNEAVKQVEKARDGQAKVIEFNRDYNRVIKDVKDDCFTKPLPPALIKLRRE